MKQANKIPIDRRVGDCGYRNKIGIRRWMRLFIVANLLIATLMLPCEVLATKFVVIGHFRDLVTDFQDILFEMAAAINEENADYVFLLGDYVGTGTEGEWQTVDKFLNKIEAPIISSPGNHENASLWEYRSRFGYLYYTLFTDDANFVFVNSSDNVSLIKGFLEPMWPALDNAKPTLLLSHFILWEKIKHKGKPYDKSFEPDEILPYLKGRVDYILSGDKPDSNEPNTLQGISMYPVGMGFAGLQRQDPVVYFVGEIDRSGQLKISPRYVQLDDDHPWYQVVDRRKLAGNRKKGYWEKIQARLKNRVFQQTAIAASVIWVTIFLLIFWRRNRNRK